MDLHSLIFYDTGLPAGPAMVGGLALGWVLARVGRDARTTTAPSAASVGTDPLAPPTGPLDAASLHAELGWRLAAGAAAAPFALLCLDLAHVALADDTLGPAVGERLVEETLRRLEDQLRRGDTLARLAPDRFAVLLPWARTPDAAGAFARRLLDELQRPYELPDATLTLRPSIGIAMAPEHGPRAEPLIENVVWAVQSASAEARGGFRFFDAERAAEARRRGAIASGLRRALAAGEFELRLHPRLNLHTRRVEAFEATAHWRHAEWGDVSPREWLPIAREAGLLAEVGDWLLRAACRAAAPGGPIDAPHEPGVAIHVDPAHLLWQQRRGGIDALLDALAFPARRLEVGVAAAMLDGSEPAAAETLQAWQARGVRIALDRFGAGDSSLMQLRRFRFDAVTLDADFVREQLASPLGRNTLETVVEWAATLGIETLALDVQSAPEAETLRRFGCTAVQGEAAGPALAPHAVAAFLRGRARPGEPR